MIRSNVLGGLITRRGWRSKRVFDYPNATEVERGWAASYWRGREMIPAYAAAAVTILCSRR